MLKEYEMFNKEQIENSVKAFSEKTGVSLEKLNVGGSGALVMLGLKETARDLDIEVNKETFQYLKEKFPEAYKPKPYGEKHPLAPGILQLLIFEEPQGDFEIMEESLPFSISSQETNGVRHYKKESIKKFKLWMGREKDIQQLKKAGLI